MQNEPVIVNGVAAIVAAFLTPILVKHGFDADTAGQVVSYAAAAVTAVLSVVALFRARAKVTPVTPPTEPTSTP